MKVAIIIERIDVNLGGAERSISELTQQLAQMGVDVCLLAAKGFSESKNIVTLCGDSKKKRVDFKQFGAALTKHFKQNSYDIIHSTLPFEFADIYQPRGGSYKEAMLRNADSYASSFLSKYKKLIHWTNTRRNELIKAEARLCAADKTTIVAALSQYVEHAFVKHFKLSRERIVTICNGVKIHTDIINTDQRTRRKELLDLFPSTNSGNEVLFLFAANNFRLKGLKELLNSFSDFKKNAIDNSARLIIAGSGKTAKFETLAAKLGIAEQVLFLGHINNVQETLQACDVAVLPTFYDPASRIIIEALAMGKPVITTSFNGSQDLFKNNRHGIIVDDPRNIKELAKALRCFSEIENVDMAKKAIQEDCLIDNISIERHARELVSLYEDILKRKNSS